MLRYQHRCDGEVFVTINGCYDLMHKGHLHSLLEAKNQGDVLAVGINSDASVRGLKGPARPLVDEDSRAEMVAALECVDYVFLFQDADPIPFLTKLKPDVHVNSVEYGDDCIEHDTVIRGGGRLHQVARIEGISTTRIINRIQRDTEK